MNSQYILRVGNAAAPRLQLLERVYGPGTKALMSRVGLQKNLTIADVGCGVGLVSLWLADQVGDSGKVWCVDNSPQQLQTAKTLIEAQGLSNTRFVASSVENLELPDDTFDIVYCRFLLDHLPDPLVAVQEMRRILKPQGTLVTETLDFSGMTSDPPQSVYENEIRVLANNAAKRGVDAGSGLKVHRLFRSSGFTDVNIGINQPAYLSGEEKRFWEYSVAESSAFLIEHGLSTEEQERARVEGMRKVNLDDSILVALPRCIQVSGKKK